MPTRPRHEVTPAPQLAIATPRHAARAARTASGRAVEWCYFGTDGSQRAAAAKAVPEASWVPVGEAVTRVATEVKQEFLDWIADIGRSQRHQVNWWASALASSNPLESDLFLLFCYTRLVHEWLIPSERSESRDEHSGPLRLVIVEDPWLALTLRRQLARHPHVVWAGNSLGACLQDAISWLVKIPRVMAATLVLALRSWWIVQRRFRAAGESIPQDTTLIYTWIQPHAFSTSGMLTDGWTGRLKELLGSQGQRVRRLTPASVPPSLLPQLQPFADQCLMTPRYLTLFQIVRAVCSWCRPQRLSRLARCRGLDYRWLLYRELLREWGQADFGSYRLGYFGMREVARCHGHRVRALIYPFENQPWEKLLCLAWRAEAPRARLIGYQHAWVPSLLLPYSLATGQEADAPLPDRIVANSAFNLACLTEGGYPASRLIHGGAFRYEYLHAVSWHATNGAHAVQTDRPARTVLVTFPISRAHAGSLFAELLSEFRHPLLLDGAPVRFMLKCHPALPMERLSQGLVALPSWMEVSHTPLGQLLPNVDLLLYVGPTSSWWEARLHGVPVLKYRTDFLDMDAGASVEGMEVSPCAQGTLRASIETLLRQPSNRSRSHHCLVEQMFGRVDEHVWTTLVKSAEDVDASRGDRTAASRVRSR